MEDWKVLKSSNIKAIKYDDLSKELDIEFVNGMQYRYDNVPISIVTGLEGASSKGSYFAQNIKTRYICKRL